VTIYREVWITSGELTGVVDDNGFESELTGVMDGSGFESEGRLTGEEESSNSFASDGPKSLDLTDITGNTV
jgi:hypothetical protein